MALVSEGLEGLIPRATELLKLGGSVFLAFLPFIAGISILFGAIYLVSSAASSMPHRTHGRHSNSTLEPDTQTHGRKIKLQPILAQQLCCAPQPGPV